MASAVTKRQLMDRDDSETTENVQTESSSRSTQVYLIKQPLTNCARLFGRAEAYIVTGLLALVEVVAARSADRVWKELTHAKHAAVRQAHASLGAEPVRRPRDFGRPVNFPRAGEKQAIRQRRAPPKKRARATPPPRVDPPETTFSYEELIFERDTMRAERDSLLIERDAWRSERDTLRGQLSATMAFKDQLLAALLKQRPASSPPNVTASVAISNNTIEMSPTMSNNQTSNQTKPGKNGVRGAQ